MLIARSSAEARKTRLDGVLDDGTRYWRTEFMKGQPGLPQSHLVEQPPASVIPAHFHEVDQFQVIVEGTGKLGRHDVRPIAVHYAGGHTAYGPIVAGAGGLAYFTLRRDLDPGAQFLPGARDRLKRAVRRLLLATDVDPTPVTKLGGVGSVSRESVLDEQTDGAAGWIMRVGAHGRSAGPDPASGGGQYHVVVGGALVHEGISLPRLSCLFLSSTESPLAITAGPEGLELLMLQFPRRSDETGGTTGS